MRIAIVGNPYVPVPAPKYGGTERVIDNLIKGLLELKHEVIFLGPGDSQVDCELIPIVDKAVYFPKTKKEVPAHNKLVKEINKNTRKKLVELKKRVDIIHSHAFDLKGFENFPNLTTIHSPIIFSNLKYYLARKNLFYVTISNNQQQSFPELRYVGVVYNGEVPSNFPIVNKPDDYLCFIGRFDREKNPHLAIELAINLGLKIKLAGKVDHLADGYFDEEVKKYFNNPLVEYLGEIDQAAKIELVAHARCNLHPTGFREPFGMTVLEAAYCGTPTLAIARGSMPELIEEGRTGMLVEDFVEGYHQIEQCFEMDRKYIANRARLLFNYKTMSKQYVNAYKSVIDIMEHSKTTYISLPSKKLPPIKVPRLLK